MTYNKQYNFEKCLGSLAIDGNSINKYSHINDGSILLRIEHNMTNRGLTGLMKFDNQQSYEEFIDAHTDEQDWFYNKARAINQLLNILSFKEEAR